MCGPECCWTFNEKVEELITTLTGDGGLGDVFEYRGLTFYPVPRDSEYVQTFDDQDNYVCIHDGKALLLIFVADEVYANYGDGDVSIGSQEDLDGYLDDYVLCAGKAS